MSQDDTIQCDCNLTVVLNLSIECIQGGICYNDPSIEGCNCYPFDTLISSLAGVWCILNAIFGMSGNLLTILAIPLAKRKTK